MDEDEDMDSVVTEQTLSAADDSEEAGGEE